MDLKELSKANFEVNKINGFHDPFPDHFQFLELLHEEISESTRCIRNDEMNYYIQNGKPEGLPIEYVDIVLRILDFVSYFGFEKYFFKCLNENIDEKVFTTYKNIDYIQFNHYLREDISSFNIMDRKNMNCDFHRLNIYVKVVIKILNLFDNQNWDFYNLAKLKIEYNQNRGYKHGRKQF